jgi:signal transduction histidine kinase
MSDEGNSVLKNFFKGVFGKKFFSSSRTHRSSLIAHHFPRRCPLAQALFPAAAYLLCSGISLGLATSVFQPARRRSEIRILHLTLTSLGCWYLLLAVVAIAPELGGALLDHLKAIIGTLLIASGVALLTATLRRFSGDSLEYRSQMIMIRAVVITIIAINAAAIYDEKYYVVAMRVVRAVYWFFASLFLILGLQVIHNLHRGLPEKRRSQFGRAIFGPPIAAKAVTSREWWAYLTLVVGSALSFHVYRGLSTGSTAVIASLLPLVALASFVYLQFRAIFVDVIVRRGTVLLILFVTGWLYFRYLGGREGVLSAGGLLFVLFWIAFNGPVARLLDRQLFGRPDHIRLVQRMSIEMMRFIERESLIRHVTSNLRSALGANWVRFLEDGAVVDDVQQEVAVRTVEKNWGRIALGPRRFGQPYKRDDIRFLRTVANQLAAVLQNFASRDEHQAQARREHELRELATQAELKALRAQINPHFLFNTLGLIAVTVDNNPKKAKSSILHLAGVFRYALTSTRRETVPLYEEIEFLTNYLELQRERFNGRFNYRIDVAEELRELPIPPMLIQPVVENAIKHGLMEKDDGGNIIIAAEARERTLCVRVEDDGVGFDPKWVLNKRRGRPDERSGVGLYNVRERIERLSGAENFRVTSAVDKGTIVEMEVMSGER